LNGEAVEDDVVGIDDERGGYAVEDGRALDDRLARARAARRRSCIDARAGAADGHRPPDEDQLGIRAGFDEDRATRRRGIDRGLDRRVHRRIANDLRGQELTPLDEFQLMISNA
jgi:hypothetical protein